MPQLRDKLLNCQGFGHTPGTLPRAEKFEQGAGLIVLGNKPECRRVKEVVKVSQSAQFGAAEHTLNGHQPRTLIFENESTARDEIGCPIDIAGRKVVNISILFTSGRSCCCEALESDRIL